MAEQLPTEAVVGLDGLQVQIKVTPTSDGPCLQLEGLNADLEGEMPGVYYLKAPPTLTTSVDREAITDPKLETEADVRRWFSLLDEEISFHPEDSFSGIVDFSRKPSVRIFTDHEAARMDRAMERAYEIVGDACEVAIKVTAANTARRILTAAKESGNAVAIWTTDLDDPTEGDPDKGGIVVEVGEDSVRIEDPQHCEVYDLPLAKIGDVEQEVA